MRILFLSRDGGGRSQMAAALAGELFGGEADCFAAGIEPSAPHPLAVETMREAGLDLATTTPLTDLDTMRLDLVVVVSERDVSVGRVPKTVKRVHWPIMDPLDPPAPEKELRERFRDTRMALSKHLKGLGKIKRKL